jgi:peroxiredoxin Q/BCP
MVSLDKPEKNAEFAASLSGNFPVLSDPGKQAAEAYGVLGFAGLYAKRWTFYIDAEGVIRYIDKNVKTSKAGADIARRLAELDFPKSEGAPE